MNVKEIVEKYLKENGFDGLAGGEMKNKINKNALIELTWTRFVSSGLLEKLVACVITTLIVIMSAVSVYLIFRHVTK